MISTAKDLLQILRQQAGSGQRLKNEPDSLLNKYQRIRQQSLILCHELEIEDFELQADDFVSPIKWHLAHTSWFFETFVLKSTPDYQVFHPQFEYLFNSYYNSIGKQYPRGKRGVMSRPTVQEIKVYRQYIDQRLNTLLANTDALTQEHYDLITLGLNHEQQHQELMLTDLKYNFSFNPLYPIYAKAKFPREQAPDSHQNNVIEPLQFIKLTGGIYNVGHKGVGFCFDNETPRHQHLVQDFRIAQRLITNEEYCLFIDSGGYQDPQYWLADGWAWVQQNNITGPLYWRLESEGQNEHTPQRFEFRLTGYGQLHPKQPVTHVSFYEADAYARWAGKRLPSEFEWEVASKKQDIEGTFVDSKSFHPLQSAPHKTSNIQYTKADIQQLFGECWQWTQSSYAPYPGFKTPLGAVGEYNGKFMCNQMVLRGGSCATPKDHFRTTYRNFFYPQDRWQFTGIRLAEDS